MVSTSAPSQLSAKVRHELIRRPSTMHGASAALAAIAALLGAGQMEALAQEIEQRDARVGELDRMPFAVHGESDGMTHASVPIAVICYCQN